MKKILVSILSLLAAISLSAQEDQVLMTIDGKPVMASEFMYIYEKNNQETGLEQKSMDEYLELFTNFKLKVAEALSQGLDTTEAFKKELAGYRAQATPKYLKDDAAIDSLIRMTYNRQCHNRRAAHIAIQCPMTADDSTQVAALAKIEEARVRVTTGLVKEVKKGKKMVKVQQPKEDFFAVAREVSSDPSVAENGGELGWITPLRFVYPFEEAVYTTPIGEVTPVFRTGYGYHIALVEEEIPTEEVHAAHIMKMVPQNNEALSDSLKAVIDALYERAKAGEDFAELAKANSDDKGSAMRGGDLGWFGRGMMVKPFEDAAFAMEPGAICEPFRSRYGWHFIYLMDRRGAQPLEAVRADLEKKVSRDERMKVAEQSFINKTRKEYGLPAEMSDADVKAYADAHLEEKYTDLKNLVQEYHDGILLFDVSLREVWDKASQDEAGLTKYFKAHKKEYTWDKPRFKGYVVYCKDAASARAAKSIIKSANPDSIQSYLNQRLNQDSVTYVKFNKGMWEQGQNPAVDKFGFKAKKAEYNATEEFPVVFCLGKVLKNPEEYMDERGKVTTAYQDELEKLWVKMLRTKHDVQIDNAVFESLKK